MMDDRAQRGLHALVPREARRLQQHYTVQVDTAHRCIALTDVDLPPGWKPRTITVRIKLPPQYPHAGPRWEFPGILRRDGTVPRHLLVAGNWLIRGTLGDPWIYWPRRWNPQRSTLVDETERALAELRDGCPPEQGSRPPLAGGPYCGAEGDDA